jgi:hypothetical protein
MKRELKGNPGAGGDRAGAKKSSDGNEVAYKPDCRLRLPLAVGGTALDVWRFMRPYGIWACADGRQVLFNRDYLPILERFPGRPCCAANPREWVWWIKQNWFYNDGTPREQVAARIDFVLAWWGLPSMPPRPRGLQSWGSRYERRKQANPWVIVLA